MAQWLRLTQARVIAGVYERLYNYARRTGPMRNKRFVLYVGFSHSGKSTHHQQSSARTNAMIGTDEIHELLNESLRFLNDDRTVSGRGYWARQFLTQWLRQKLLRQLCAEGYNVVQDSCNLVRRERAERLAIPKKFGYRTTIVQVDCSEDTLLHRLHQDDVLNQRCGRAPTWVRLYREVQLRRYEPPTSDESDELLEVSGE